MSSPPVRHPDDRLLVAFQLSKLDQRQIAIVNKHVKECRECRHRLAHLAAEMEIPVAPAVAPPAPLRPQRRPPNLLWLVAGGIIALVGVGLAWTLGAFSGQSSSERVAESLVTNPEPEPKTPAPSSTVSPLPTQPAKNSTTTGQATANVAPAKPDDQPAKTSIKLGDPATAAPPTASTDRANNTSPSATANSTQPFFNGTNLTGWNGPSDIWRIENGAIAGTLSPPRKQAAFLASRERYTDFDLMFQATVEGGIGDCGVHFRSQIRSGDPLPVAGPCCAIYGKDAPADHRTGSLVIEPGHKLEKAPTAQRVERFVDPVQNQFRIRCQGKHVLIEVNGVKMINGDFPSLPDEGNIAWKIDANRPPHKVAFKVIRFVDLSQPVSSGSAARPSLSDLELLRAEIKFEGAVKKADETLLNHFDPEVARLKRSSHAKDGDLVEAVEHEKELFKTKGLVPWSRPMRKWLLQYGKELRDAQRSVGNAFDAAIERAEKAHNDRLKESLMAEAAQVLIPREVAAWEFADRRRVVRRSFYSDGTFTEGTSQAAGEPEVETRSRFWSAPVEDMLMIEFPDPKDPTATNQQEFEVAADGKMLVAQNSKGQKQVWRRVEELSDKGEAQP